MPETVDKDKTYKFCSVTQSCLTLCKPMDCSTPDFAYLSFTISPSSLKLMSIELVMQSNHLILCCPLLLLPSVFPRIKAFDTGKNHKLHIHLYILLQLFWLNIFIRFNHVNAYSCISFFFKLLYSIS